MHILQVHNRYIHLGGEDFVIAQEKLLLENAGHKVSQYFAKNEEINTGLKKVKTAFSMPYNFKRRNHLKAVLKKLRPDVVHVHNVFPILSPAIIDAIASEGIPVVVTLHNYRLLCVNGILYREGNLCTKCITKPLAVPGVAHGCYQDSSMKSIFPAITNHVHTKRKTWEQKVSKFIMLTEFTRAIFDKSHLKIPEKKIAIKSNFAPDQTPVYEKEDSFLFVGRLSEEKGLKTVVQAFIASGDTLKVAGEGPLLVWLTEQSIQYKNIIVLGFQNQEELKLLYQNSRALVYASRWYETFGLVIIEAFSFGTPVIAPDFGNAGIFVKEGYNGAKYELNSSESLAKTIQDFKKNPKEIALRRGARSSYEEQFTPEKNLKILLKIYKESMAES